MGAAKEGQHRAIYCSFIRDVGLRLKDWAWYNYYSGRLELV